MPRQQEQPSLELREVLPLGSADGAEFLALATGHGSVTCRWHPAPAGDAAVLWVFGAGGGLGGPAGGLYPRLARRLAPAGVASLEVAYRRPGRFDPCVLDVLLGVGYLGALGRTRVVLVGHSFGGAVAIAAGAASRAVVGVAALSSQTAGAGAVAALAPKPLLLMHGTADEVLPADCSRALYEGAGEPKELVLFPGCRHGLDECREAVDRDLLAWLRRVTAAG